MQHREGICLVLSAACAEESFGKANKKRETSRGHPAPNLDLQLTPPREGQGRERGRAPTCDSLYQSHREGQRRPDQRIHGQESWRGRPEKLPELAPHGLAFLDPGLNLGDLPRNPRKFPSDLSIWWCSVPHPSESILWEPPTLQEALMPHSASLALQGLHGSRLQRGGAALFPGRAREPCYGRPEHVLMGAECSLYGSFYR